MIIVAQLNVDSERWSPPIRLQAKVVKVSLIHQNTYLARESRQVTATLSKQQNKMNITELPNDIFLLIISYLSPPDLITNRSVSKRFHATFTESDLSRHMLQQHFPRTRELRKKEPYELASKDWACAFAKVASRYHHLQSGTARKSVSRGVGLCSPSHLPLKYSVDIVIRIEKLAIGKSFVAPSWCRFYAVAPFQRHLQFEEKSAPFHYPDTLWTYDEGLLIFPSAEFQSYVLYDIGCGLFSKLDFEPGGRIVRRIRLHQYVLVIEWCEPEAYHQLNENEMVYRHFATAYDISKNFSTGQWTIVFR